MLGCLNPVLYYLLLFEAYDRLPAQIAQPLNYTWVLVLAVLAGPMLGQRPDRRTFAGLLISYTGVLLVVTQGQLFEQPPWDATGVVLALASTVIWALYWVLNARAGADATPLLTWSFTLSLPALMLIAMRTDAWPAFAPVPLAAAIWVGLFEMGLTFVLWQRALALSANAARLGQLVFLSPFLSLVFIATVLSETVTAWSVSGLVIIVSGILVTRRT